MSVEDPEAVFVDLYERYYRAIVSYIARGFGFLPEEARDLAQEAFMRVYRNMDRYQGKSKWKFLKVTAANVALNEIRRRNTLMRDGIHVPIEGYSNVPDGQSSPEERVSEREEFGRQQKWLRGAIKRLPDAPRECLLLRLSGLQYTEIQEVLDISSDAVKSRLHDARSRLRAMLADDADRIDWPQSLLEDNDDQEK